MTSESIQTTSLQQAHSYATRVRQSVSLKPSIRIKHVSEPQRTIRPAPPPPEDHPDSLTTPQTPFPSLNVVLHPDDANSKVFHAIARALLSVNNRAMTVKDLAEMCLSQGLQCQNVNAASQAITTYTRDHIKRCDQEQDQPLLLRHILSGNPADDLLLPALYSTSGGGCPRDPRLDTVERITNFRKGTVIWYLSRVTGAPCPFARAGIRLSDHVETAVPATSRTNVKRPKEIREDQCGEKRKRRSTRECVVRSTKLPDSSHSDNEHSDLEGEPPAKVKLVVRLKPLATFMTTPPSRSPPPSEIIDLSADMDDDDESDSMSVDEDDDSHSASSLEDSAQFDPFPQMANGRSISIPPYTPSSFSTPSSYPPANVPESLTRFRRSTSVPDSMASPPPDSDDEDEDSSFDDDDRSTSFPMSPSPFDVDDDDYASSDFSSEFGDNDADTSFESPGPRSPFSAAPISLPSIKQEPRDVQGILDAWEGLDSMHFGPTTDEEARVVEVIGKAATRVLKESGHMTDDDLLHEQDGSDWDSQRSRWSASPLAVKQEEDSSNLTLDFGAPSFTSWRTSDLPISPLSASPPGPDPFQFDEFFSSPTHRRGSESLWDKDEPRHSDTLRPRANTVASLGGMFTSEEYGSDRTTLTKSLSSLIESLSVTAPSAPPTPSNPEEFSRFGSLPQPVCVSPSDIRLCANGSSTSFLDREQAVVVNTCQPSNPAIVATQIEGISVYRTMLGDQVVLRRIDTDYVNLTPILAYSKTPTPILSTIPSTNVITDCCSTVNGVWVPLEAAQAYIEDHPIPSTSTSPGALHLFLSDKLADRFPPALRDFVQSSRRTTVPGQFGKRFGSPQAKDLASQAALMVVPPIPPILEEEERPASSPYDGPLTETEKEIFQSICVNLEWEKDEPTPRLPTEEVVPAGDPDVPKASCSEDSRPLRRSRRVADAKAAKTRTRR